MVTNNRARTRAIRQRMDRTGETFATAARNHDTERTRTTRVTLAFLAGCATGALALWTLAQLLGWLR